MADNILIDCETHVGYDLGLDHVASMQDGHKQAYVDVAIGRDLLSFEATYEYETGVQSLVHAISLF